MGAWGAVCEFDHRRYREVVVPAFRAGERHPLIASAVALLEPDWHSDFAGLADVMAHFTADLGDSDLGRTFTTPSGWDYEQLAELFEWVVTREAIRSYANLGSTGRSAWHVWDLVDDDGEPALGLLADLDPIAGWRYWTHNGGGWAEGIAGWLDADRTRELAAEVPPPYADPGTPLHDRQTRFHVVLNRALAHDNGLLWGRDLGILHDRGERMFCDGRPRPEEIPFTGVS